MIDPTADLLNNVDLLCSVSRHLLVRIHCRRIVFRRTLPLRLTSASFSSSCFSRHCDCLDSMLLFILCCVRPARSESQQDGTGFDFKLSSLVFTLLSLIGLYCSSRYCICFNSMLVCIFCITLKPCILESSLLFVSQLSTERDEFENELKKLKDSRNRQLDENDELRRIKAENTALHRKLQGSAFTIDLVVLAFCIFHRSYIK